MSKVRDKRVKILTFVSYYLPGFKAGGPVTTIQNLVALLGAEYEFMIVTRNHDHADPTPYQDVQVDHWNPLENTQVLYLPGKRSDIFSIYRLLTTIPYDVIYLNSFFDLKLSFIPNLIRKFFCSNRPVILAPRGEFSGGALSLNSRRKHTFIWLFKLLGLAKSITFQASSVHEKEDIKRALNISDNCIKIASDLPTTIQKHDTREEDTDQLKVIFLSRISPMKNLQFAIQTLQLVSSPTTFNIYGPQEDQRYWQQCEALLNELPENVQWRYCGIAQPSSVKSILASHDLMFLPTLGENYGHVIAESISVGTSVLISDCTPWRELQSKGFGWDFNLEHQHVFAEKIEAFAQLTLPQREQVRQRVLGQAADFLCTPEQIEDNYKLFEHALQQKKSVCT
ncbi:MAG: glycosyltransferase family 4 protein [Candidatus Polarisedimenticolaceae bacterium]|nr:glycosyltransferase family 4 protein [Candidatus Polarisedimenticolaceae bacterium]